MATDKILAVVGATGNQGGSVARTFLSLPGWHVRAITRSPASSAAQALKAEGAEVVQADLSDQASLSAAFAGASAIFLNTDFWATFYPEKARLEAENKDVAPASQTAYDRETAYGKNAAMAAAGVATLERIVFSCLPSISKGGQYTRSLHPESKNWIAQYIEQEQPALAKKLSVIYLGAYHTNRMLEPTMKDPTSGMNRFILPIDPEANMPVIDPAKSTGPFVRELIETEAPGIKLLAYDTYLTLQGLIDTWSRATGQPAEYIRVTPEDMHAKGMLWEHLDAIDFLSQNKSGYEAAVPGIIQPHQLRNKVETVPWETTLKQKSQAQA